MTKIDKLCIESFLIAASVVAFTDYNSKIKILEIGICHGHAAKEMKNVLDGKGISFDYYGIDSERDRKIDLPFGNVIIGDSSEVYNQLPDDFHFILIDGCHCVNHVILDFIHYSNKLLKNGYILFHDTASCIKDKKDYQEHGPRENSDFYIAVRRALELLRIDDRNDFVKVLEGSDSSFDYGGITVYKKIK